MALLGRIIVIFFALFMATAMAGIATAIALLGAELHMVGADPVEHVFFWGTAAFASGVTVLVGFLPILIAVVLAEAFAIRSLVIQAAAGAAILLLGYYSAGFAGSLRGIDRSSAAADLAPGRNRRRGRGRVRLHLLADRRPQCRPLARPLTSLCNACSARPQAALAGKTMNRTGLIIALAVAAVVGVIFGLFPQLDLMISAPFNAMVVNGNNFAPRIYPPLMLARDIGLWVGTAIVIPVVAALLLKLLLPRRRLLLSGRAIVFLISTIALGPGLLVNVTLKDHWGRPRPIDVTQFGGDQHFVAWWDPRGDCPGNCSFVSGDVSGAVWTIAPAALVPPPWRAIAYGAALALGIGMAAVRIMAGGHFFTDTVFAGVFTFLIIWVVHGLIYRWPRTRLTDEAVERAIERFALPGHDFHCRIAAQAKDRTLTRPAPDTTANAIIAGEPAHTMLNWPRFM